MANNKTTVPDFSTSVINPVTGSVDPVWYQFFIKIFDRTELIGTPVTNVIGADPIVSSGGVTPIISIIPATTIDAGSMSGADKAKLNGIAPGATLASITGTAPIVVGGSITVPNVTINPATTAAPGSLSSADKTKLDSLSAGATVASVSGSAPISSTGGATPNISISNVTTATDGSMTAADKLKLNGISSGASVASVTGIAPILSSGGASPAISINAATSGAPGSMSSADKIILDAMTSGGVWTPAITCATPGNLAITYNVQSASYTKVGRMVFVNFVINTSSFTWSTASGGVVVTGLPLISGVPQQISGHLDWGGITKTGYSSFSCVVLNSDSKVSLLASGSGVTRALLNIADMPSGGTVFLSGNFSYFV